MSEWQRGRWWRVIAPDGSLWCETSDKQEARMNVRPGDTLQHLWVKYEEEWRDDEPQEKEAGMEEAQERISVDQGTTGEQEKPPPEILDIVDAWLVDNSPENVQIFSWQVVYAEHWARVKAWRDKQ